MRSKPTPLSHDNQKKLREYIEDNFDVKGISGDEVTVSCTQCEDGDPKGHLNINTRYGFGHCLKCDFSPSFRKRLNVQDKVVSVSEFDKAIASLEEQSAKSIERLRWPESFEQLPSSSVFGKLAMRYLLKRKFNPEEVAKKYNLGVCTSGRYMGRLILPVFEEGVLVYYQARSLMRQKPKFLNPPEEEEKRGKAEFIFNLDTAAEEEIVFLVEGFFDAMRIGDAAAALFGKTISQSQLEKLILAGVKKVAVFLDSDAKKESRKLAKVLLPHFETFICQPPDGFDPDEYISTPSKKRVKILRANLKRILNVG